MTNISGACGVCGKEFLDKAVIICPECKVPHHEECWSYNGGCSIFGCNWKTSVTPDKQVTNTKSITRLIDRPAPPELSDEQISNLLYKTALYSSPFVLFLNILFLSWGSTDKTNLLLVFVSLTMFLVSLFGTIQCVIDQGENIVSICWAVTSWPIRKIHKLLWRINQKLLS